jgi:hypothetical protein
MSRTRFSSKEQSRTRRSPLLSASSERAAARKRAGFFGP